MNDYFIKVSQIYDPGVEQSNVNKTIFCPL